jgi:hypothetical protein
MDYLQSADPREFGLATAAQLLAIATPEALAMLIVDGDTLTRGITASTTVATTTTPMTAVTTHTGVPVAIWFATKTLFEQGRMTSGLAWLETTLRASSSQPVPVTQTNWLLDQLKFLNFSSTTDRDCSQGPSIPTLFGGRGLQSRRGG